MILFLKQNKFKIAKKRGRCEAVFWRDFDHKIANSNHNSIFFGRKQPTLFLFYDQNNLQIKIMIIHRTHWEMRMKKTMSFVRVCRWIENGMRAPTQRITIIILHESVILYKNHMCIALDAVQNAYLSCLTNVLCVCFCAVWWSITYELKTVRCASTRYYNQNFALPQLIYI